MKHPRCLLNGVFCVGLGRRRSVEAGIFALCPSAAHAWEGGKFFDPLSAIELIPYCVLDGDVPSPAGGTQSLSGQKWIKTMVSRRPCVTDLSSGRSGGGLAFIK
jgi:hypothetical protein